MGHNICAYPCSRQGGGEMALMCYARSSDYARVVGIDHPGRVGERHGWHAADLLSDLDSQALRIPPRKVATQWRVHAGVLTICGRR